MSEVFGTNYAALYDTTYAEKDYAGEVDGIVGALHQYGVSSGTVLDLGCGTGRHAEYLSRAGFAVMGVDRSAPMLEKARSRLGQNVDLREGDIRTFRTDRRFDAVTMLFAVLGYQLENSDLEAALSTVRAHLQPGGLFVCDFWYGPAVLMTRPEPRLKVTETEGTTLIRASSATVDANHHSCTVSIEMWLLDGDTLESHVREDHVMRYFFPKEIDMALAHNGLELVDLRSFPDMAEIRPDTWNVVALARANS